MRGSRSTLPARTAEVIWLPRRRQLRGSRCVRSLSPRSLAEPCGVSRSLARRAQSRGDKTPAPRPPPLLVTHTPLLRTALLTARPVLATISCTDLAVARPRHREAATDTMSTVMGPIDKLTQADIAINYYLILGASSRWDNKESEYCELPPLLHLCGPEAARKQLTCSPKPHRALRPGLRPFGATAAP